MNLRLHTIVIAPLPSLRAGAAGDTRTVATRHAFRFRNISLVDRVLDAAPADVLVAESEYCDDVTSLVEAALVVPFALAPKTARARAPIGRASSPNAVFWPWGLDAWTYRARPGEKLASWRARRESHSTVQRWPRAASGARR